MNVEKLLIPLREDAPCGDNLEYDAAFMALDQARNGKAEQQFGETIIPAEPPDWPLVARQALDLLERTRDIRLILILTEAWTYTRGLSGFANGLTLLSLSLERYWQSLHPPLEFDGQPDPMLRASALAALSEQSSLAVALRQCWLIKSNTGEISFRDATSLLDGSKSEIPGFPGGTTRLREELRQHGNSGAINVRTINTQLQSLKSMLAQYLEPADRPDISMIEKSISLLLPYCPLPEEKETLLTSNEAEGESLSVQPASSAKESPPALTDWRQVSLQSRADAELMLEKIRVYFLEHEPSHPAPIMLERVQRLIQLDFLEIIRDLAPDAVNQLQGLFGRTGE